MIPDDLRSGFRSDRWDDRCDAIAKLTRSPKLLAPDQVRSFQPFLLALARDEHWQVRAAVAEFLLAWRPPYFDDLAELLEDDPDGNVRKLYQRVCRKWRRADQEAKEEDRFALEALRPDDPAIARQYEEYAWALLQEATKTIAHDFLSHANTISGAQQEIAVAARNGLPPTAALQRLTDVIQGITGLSNELRRFGAREPLEFRRELLSKVVAKAARSVSSSHEGPAFKLVEDVPSNLQVDLPRAVFQSALENLIRNAAQAMNRLEVGARRQILIRAEEDGDEVLIAIQDTGPGFPTSTREWFLPGKSTRKGSPGSQNMGMGLTIADGIVRRCGGRIELESVRGRGACVTIVIPRFEVKS